MSINDKIIFYFILYSFLGWCLESVYKSILQRKTVNSGFLYGPFCPMYGLGAIMMIELSRISKNVIVIFILGFLVFSIWEYIVAVILEKLFKTKYWDYSNIKFNIKGRVCLKNSIYWGILAVLLTFIIQPLIEKFTNIIPVDILLYTDIILCIAIGVDAIITIFKIMFIDKKITEVFELGETIKKKLVELRKTETIEKPYKESLQKIIDELKIKQATLKFKLYKRIVRLKKSFPEMHSENIARFMKQKISLDDLKKKIKEYKEK